MKEVVSTDERLEYITSPSEGRDWAFLGLMFLAFVLFITFAPSFYVMEGYLWYWYYLFVFLGLCTSPTNRSHATDATLIVLFKIYIMRLWMKARWQVHNLHLVHSSHTSPLLWQSMYHLWLTSLRYRWLFVVVARARAIHLGQSDKVSVGGDSPSPLPLHQPCRPTRCSRRLCRNRALQVHLPLHSCTGRGWGLCEGDGPKRGSKAHRRPQFGQASP